jgi:hypothetical protein
MVGFEEPILAVIVAVEIDPIHGAIGKLDLARSVTR